jgi:dTDP-4-dehydrorhamnose 3,5-epimerase
MPDAQKTPIPGLVIVPLAVHHDDRGSFTETWHRERLRAPELRNLGLRDLRPVQQNLSFNHRRGVTRGVHAEPWDKVVTLGSGRVFAAWVDLRPGKGFGLTFHCELEPGVAVHVPRGVGNSYQTLEDGTLYCYLVDDHWRADRHYSGVHPGDPALAVPWPIPLERAELSERDRALPVLADVMPVPPRRTLILGARGLLGRALVEAFPEAEPVASHVHPVELERFPWHDIDVILNAAAYTDVDAAETTPGRAAAWAANAVLPAALARISTEHGIKLVHYSSDYVFDGTRHVHDENEPPTPINAYGQSKAAGDLAVTASAHHLIIRTSWLTGPDTGFVATMRQLARSGATPEVVDDQFGRLTTVDELVRATRHLLDRDMCGTVNVSHSGRSMSWFDIATEVFRLCGRDPSDVRPTSTAAWFARHHGAARPLHSTLDLGRLESTGFVPEPAMTALARMLEA